MEKETTNSSYLRKEFILEGLDCASCAQKIESKIKNLKNVRKCTLNFTTKKLKIDIMKVEEEKNILEQSIQIINNLEPEVKIISANSKEGINAKVKRKFNKKKKDLRLISGSIIFAFVLLLNFSLNFEIILFITAYLLIGGGVVLKALTNIKQGRIFDENFLMTIATTGAFIIGEFPEAVAVMLFYKIGERLQNSAVDSSRRSITELMDLKSDYANLELKDSLKEVAPEEVTVGNKIVIKPGERVPLDGVVIEGQSYLDTSALTGESKLRLIKEGSKVLSGSINQDGLLRLKVTKKLADSTANRILSLVEEASSKKAPTEKFITKFARYYTPVVVGTALAIALIPPLFFSSALWQDWFYRALVFLVISCPCALVISIPLAFFGGIGGASKKGILVKGANYLEALNELENIVFDKTGTLSKGNFEVKEILTTNDYSSTEILELAAHAELHSTHPIAKSILNNYSGILDKKRIKNYQELAGQGIKVEIDEQEILLGNDQLLSKLDINFKSYQGADTALNITKNGQHLGYIVISDQLRESSRQAIAELKQLGIKNLIMLTGDRQEVAEKVAAELAISNYQSELLPQDKIREVERIIFNSSGNTLFIGDGINDAPVLARADIGVAMGGLGSEAAIEAADIVLMTDEPIKLVSAIKVAQFTRKIVLQNIFLALGIKALVLILGVLGLATLWGAVFADVGVTILAVLNSIRITKMD